jgi:hypothetical protein
MSLMATLKRVGLIMGWMVAGVFGGLVPVAMRAQVLVCPATIVTKQEAQGAAVGWVVGRGDVPARLAGVTFYSGPPEERASLVSDSNVTRGGLVYATWRFQPRRTEVMWLSCSYSATSVILSKRIAMETTECTVSYNPKVTVAGLPEIQKITCK